MEYSVAINKTQNHVLCRDMYGGGGYYSQQTNPGMENQILHALTCKWELNDENTWMHRGEQHSLDLSEGTGLEEGEGQKK